VGRAGSRRAGAASHGADVIWVRLFWAAQTLGVFL